ncbi:E3 ubiquitin-protein ligase RNF186 [Physeter macrocephalus]|uniref:RING-type E3 ubiquitin transferase n=1 Tax=Physeter macrocephalus TaxID=9755 RepID=A0A2Y9FFC1_PHYMC|nr:E3 ubiquitin-protein ligase RNF186 [Physeter catodon]|eukprot:XP_007121638.1 E3 ubiquitin-protein ligase RNF186 [Physeter catodon]
MACSELLQQPQLTSKETTASNTAGPAGGHRGSTDGDLECLVCREPYSSARRPKLLGCQHTFCAVCLKLLLCVQDDTWSIACPLCRKVTAVPGGLICSLRDQEAMLGRLARPGPEVRLCPQGLVNPATLIAGHPSLAGEDEQDTESANCLAARRLAAHLLLLALLVALTLPFIYPGVVCWMLSFIIVLALLLSMLLCCGRSSQGSRCSSPRTLFCREQKPSEISSVA